MNSRTSARFGTPARRQPARGLVRVALVTLAAITFSLATSPVSVLAAGPAAFASPPTFSDAGLASAVFGGGTVDQLEATAQAVGANGIWIQDASGTFRLLVVGSPAFLKDDLKAKFPSGIPITGVTLTRAQTPVAATPAGSDIVFEFLDTSLPQADKDLIRDTASFTRDFYQRQMGLAVGPITFRIENNPGASPQPFTQGSLIRINTAPGSYWAGSPTDFKKHTISHEYVHALEVTYGVSFLGANNLFWRKEGAAEYAASRADAARGGSTVDVFRQQQLATVKFGGKRLPSIHLITAQDDAAPAYALSFLAMDFLLRDRGMSGLGDLIRNSVGQDPATAFQQTFGESLDAFEARFDAYRATIAN